MEYCKITAIVRTLSIHDVEKHLIAIGVPGMTVSRVSGFGEYSNLYTRDGMTQHMRIEIFADHGAVEAIRNAICETASTGGRGDGIIAVEPVESIYRIRDKSPSTTVQLRSP